MNKTIEMIPCTTDEVKALQEIGRTTFYETFKDLNTEENMTDYLATAFTVQKLTDELMNPQSFFYFAKDADQVVGYLKLNVDEAQTEAKGASTLEIERIYILSSYQKFGIGKQFMQQAIEQAKTLEKTAIWLGVWEKNKNAIAFYERAGFIKTGEHVFQMGDDAQTDFVMEKTFV